MPAGVVPAGVIPAGVILPASSLRASFDGAYCVGARLGARRSEVTRTMLIRIESDVGGFSTFRDVAVKLLGLAGHSGTVPGAILAADVPAALAKLERALESAPRDAEAGDDDDDEPPVGLRQRAFPLVELLRDAVANDSDVRWREQ